MTPTRCLHFSATKTLPKGASGLFVPDKSVTTGASA
jgi:hypothetical protein